MDYATSTFLRIYVVTAAASAAVISIQGCGTYSRKPLLHETPPSVAPIGNLSQRRDFDGFLRLTNKTRISGDQLGADHWSYIGVRLVKQVDNFDLTLVADRELHWIELDARGQVVGAAEVPSKLVPECSLVLNHEQPPATSTGWWLSVKSGPCTQTCKLTTQPRGLNIRILSECLDIAAARAAQ